jgi:predicted GNAT family N-acyltransferase
MSDLYTCIQIEFGTPEFDEALKLRDIVLRQPLNMTFDPEDIALEYDSYHIACYNANTFELLACLILKPKDVSTVKMRQVAVHPDLQSKGVGSFLVAESENFAKRLGYKKIELHARDTAVNFYKKASYNIAGEVFKEVGIDHYFMWKDI